MCNEGKVKQETSDALRMLCILPSYSTLSISVCISGHVRYDMQAIREIYLVLHFKTAQIVKKIEL